MAGIGFRLKALMRDDVTGGWIRAHVYGAVVSSGPWLLSVVTLATLSVLARSVIADAAQDLFRSMVAYTYTFTLITTGAAQMVVTRHLADELFTGRADALRPIFRWSIGATALGHMLLAGVFYGLAPDLTWPMRVLGVGLTVVVACTWIAMIFVGALQDYASVGRAFLLGNVASLVGALGLGRLAGPAGYVAGFALGQAAIFFTLSARIEREFPGDAPDEERRILRAFRKYPDLALAGFLYNVAIAIDRIIFWASPEGWRVTSWFFGSLYDTPLFLAYISTVPALAIFLVRVETDFYDAYRTYYGAVIKQGTLRQILEAKATMARSLRESLRRLLQVQTPVTVLLLVLTPWIAVGDRPGARPVRDLPRGGHRRDAARLRALPDDHAALLRPAPDRPRGLRGVPGDERGADAGDARDRPAALRLRLRARRAGDVRRGRTGAWSRRSATWNSSRSPRSR